MISKKVLVVDPGLAPFLKYEPPVEWKMEIGSRLEIPFSDFSDPEGNPVFFTIRMREAHKFAKFDYDTMKLTIEKRVTKPADAGEYPITVQLTEYVNGTYMPSRSYELILEIGKGITEDKKLPPLKVAPDGVNIPRASIKYFGMDGRMRIKFSKPLSIPSNIRQKFTEITLTEVPMYGEDEEVEYLRNIIRIELIAGEMSDPDLLRFNYTLTDIDSREITIKFKWEHPLELSQNDPPERMRLVLNMEKYVDEDGLSLERDLRLTCYVPRQVLSEDEVNAISAGGIGSNASSGGAMFFSFVSSFMVGASLNYLWSMMNGLQLIEHLPLFFTPFPANANYFVTFSLDLANFEIFPDEIL